MLEKPYTEKEWQNVVCDIVRIIYPQYILAKREINILRDDRHDKQPDFLLVDSNGFVDVLEIKRPDKQRLVTRKEYRNNYVADKDLSGAVVQVEKYIYCLNHNGKSLEERFNSKFRKELPNELKIRIVNPRGILLMGRTRGLSKDQCFDFEVIRRQYKNIVDLMTYDDLVLRLKNMIDQLKRK